VESGGDLQVILQCEGRPAVALHPIEVSNPLGAKVTLPDDLEDGDYDVEVLNRLDRASIMLPIKLRIGKAAQARKIE